MRTFRYEPQRYQKSTPVFVYDRNEKMNLILSDDTLPYTGWAPFRLNESQVIELDVMANDPRIEKIENEGRLVTQDANGDFIEFIIRTLEDSERGMKRVEGEGAEYELIDEWLESYIQPAVDLKTALEAVLQGTRFEVGEVDNYRQRSVKLERMSKRKAVNELMSLFGADVKYTVEPRGNHIARRYVNAYDPPSRSIGRRFEAGKDILSTKRVFDSTDIKTALYGYGAADADGNRLTFADVEWRKEWGDPADKPIGQHYVGDVDAMARWGAMAGRKHKFGGYDGQEEDAATLLLNTWNELQKQNQLRDTYEVNVVNLGEILDYPHEKVRLGDRVDVINHELMPPLETHAYVIEYRHNLNDPHLSEVTLGHFRANPGTDRAVEDVKKSVGDNKGKWDKAPEKAKQEAVEEAGEIVRESASETKKWVDGEIAGAQDRIDAAKKDIEDTKLIIDKAKSDLARTERELAGAKLEIADAKTDIANTKSSIESVKSDISKAKSDLSSLDSAVKNKVPIGMAAADVNSSNTKILGKNLVVDGSTTVTGTIGASTAVFNDLTTRRMTAIDSTIQNATITGRLDAASATFINLTTESMKAIDAVIEGARITGSISGSLATFLDATFRRATIIDAAIEDATITGTLKSVDGVFTGRLDGVNGTFIGDLVGARIYSSDTTFVGSDLTVTDNIYLGDRGSRSTKGLYFNSGAYIEGGTGLFGNGLKINADSLELRRDSVLAFNDAGYGGSKMYVDPYDRNRLKIEHEDGSGAAIYMEDGAIRFLFNGVQKFAFYDTGSFEKY